MQAELTALLDRLVAGGVTVLLSTHDVDFAFHWADDIHLMAAGRCIGSGTAMQLIAQPEVLRAAKQQPPVVLALHGALVARGMLPASPLPRSVDALVNLLHALPVSDNPGDTKA
jgi:cobalt/nickel transport system ATP-binding protein